LRPDAGLPDQPAGARGRPRALSAATSALAARTGGRSPCRPIRTDIGLIRRRILLVEDNPDDESLTQRALRRGDWGAEVIVARDGAAALETLATMTELPDLVLLDLKLPKLDGTEGLQQLRDQAGGLRKLHQHRATDRRVLADAQRNVSTPELIRTAAYFSPLHN
jgi:CheY-like chemotaxis protein